MKRLISMLLVIAMITAFIPSAFAAENSAATYSFLSTAIDGSNKISTVNATYENTETHGSGPWAYVNALAANNNTSYNYVKCYNWYGTETFKEPQFVCNDEYDYEHCKPVSPDDDIIYKGE